jgi:hypothetical protein
VRRAKNTETGRAQIFLGTPPVVLIHAGTLDASGGASIALPAAAGIFQKEDVKAVARLMRAADITDSRAFVWVTPGDMVVLRALEAQWAQRIRDEKGRIQRAAVPSHLERLDSGRCQEYDVREHGLDEVQKPKHADQVVLVGTIPKPDGRRVHAVSRFEPGDVPAIDAARAVVAASRAELRAQIGLIRAGR